MNVTPFHLPKYVWFALIAGILLRLWLIFAMPLQTLPGSIPAFNDEFSHWNNVLYQRDAKGLPHPDRNRYSDSTLITGSAEYWQPILYYQLSATILKVFTATNHGEYFIRLFSFLLWYLALWILSISVPLPRMRDAILAVGSLLGATLPASATINNDALLAVSCALLYGFSALLISRKFQWHDFVLLGAIMALGAYSKLPAVVLWIMPLSAILMSGFYNRFTKWVRVLQIAGLVFVLTYSLWAQRLAFYHSILGISNPIPIGFRQAVVAFCYSLVCPWQEPWSSYWVKLPGLIYVIASLGALIWGWHQRAKFLSGINVQTRSVLLVWGIGGGCGILAWLINAIMNHQTEARLLLIAAPALVLAVCWSLWSLPERIAKKVGWCVVIAMCLPYLSLLR